MRSGRSPVTATMVAIHGDKEKRASVDELAKLAATMPVHMLPQLCEEGSFVMWYDTDDGCSSGGTIVEKEAGVLTVIRRQQNTVPTACLFIMSGIACLGVDQTRVSKR